MVVAAAALISDIPMAGLLEVLSTTQADEYGWQKILCSGTYMIIGTGEDGWKGCCMDKLVVPQCTEPWLKMGMKVGSLPLFIQLRTWAAGLASTAGLSA